MLNYDWSFKLSCSFLIVWSICFNWFVLSIGMILCGIFINYVIIIVVLFILYLLVIDWIIFIICCVLIFFLLKILLFVKGF